MDELITDAQAEWLVAIAAAVLLVASLVALAVGGAKWRAWTGPRGLILSIAAGPILYALWRVDALLIDGLGFDTLLRAVVELVGAIVIGLGIGFWLRGQRRAEARDS